MNQTDGIWQIKCISLQQIIVKPIEQRVAGQLTGVVEYTKCISGEG